MAKGAEIYRKIEHAYSTCNWAEVSRLAKKYRRRGDLSEEWECILEGMAGLWRALDRYTTAVGPSAHIKAVDLVKLEPSSLREVVAVIKGASGKAVSVGLIPAVQAIALCLSGDHTQAVSLFNTTSIGSTVASPVSHLVFHNQERVNSSREIPMVEVLVSLHAVLFKGMALEGVEKTTGAIDQYNIIQDFYNRCVSAGSTGPEEGCCCLAIIKCHMEAIYRKAMLSGKSSPTMALSVKQALLAERAIKMEYDVVRRLLLCERWLDLMPSMFRRQSLRTAVDSSICDVTDLVAESLEEERVWTCQKMIISLHRLYQEHRVIYSANRDFVDRLNNVVIKNLSMSSAHHVVIDFLKTAVYGRMPVGRQYYTHLFLALLAAQSTSSHGHQYTLSEAYLAGDILMQKYGTDLCSSIRSAFLMCCYRLGLFDRIVAEEKDNKNTSNMCKLWYAKALLMKARNATDDWQSLVLAAQEVVLSIKSGHCYAESLYLLSACKYELRDLEKALSLIEEACQADPAQSKYRLYKALLLSAQKDYQSCMSCLNQLWSEHLHHSIDLTLAKARCEQALGRPLAAIDTLASRLSYNVAQAAQAAASTTIFSSSENDPNAMYHLRTATTGSVAGSSTGSRAVSDGNLSRAAGFLSEPAVDILQSKIGVSEFAIPSNNASGTDPVVEYEQAFPKDPIEFRAERLEHRLHIPGHLPKHARLQAVEREQYSELSLLLELSMVYLANAHQIAGHQEEVEYCLSCIKRLDPMLPQLYYLQGLADHDKKQHDQQVSMFERSIEYGGCVEGVLAVARIAISRNNAAFSKMLLTRGTHLLSGRDHRVSLLLAQSCMQLGQVEEAGEHVMRAMTLEEHSTLYTPHQY